MRVLLFLLGMGAMAWAQTPMKWQLPLKNNQANELFEKQKFDESRQLYESMLEKDPENGALAYNLGNVYNALGDQGKATEMYQKALKSNNAEAASRSRFNMGTLDLQSKKPQDAIKNLSQYLRSAPNDLDAKRNLELALRMLEQQKQQNKDDKNNKDQQDQQQQQQEQQSQSQQNEDEKQQGQQQDQQEQQNQQQQQDQKNQQQQNQNDQNDAQDQKERQEQQQKDEQEKLNDQVKQQILDALDEQELRQQKQYQQRKIGTVRRRAKDW